MKKDFDGSDDLESYVREILADMPPGLTAVQFQERCRPHLHAGYHFEVDLAERRYFQKGNRP